MSHRRSPGHGPLATVAVACLAILGLPALPAASPAAGQEKDFTAYPLEVRYDVQVPMRDGVNLSADVYRPRDAARHPAVFVLTPYNNNSDRSMDEAWDWVKRGYAFVDVDARGRYDSEGDFDAWYHDTEDGSDVLSWIAAQPWSNGRVATMGASYSGMNQWLMAREANPAHAAILGYVAPADGFHDLVRWNGVPKVDLIYTWLMGMDGRINQSRDDWEWSAIMRELPLVTLDSVAGRDMGTWRRWMEHDVLDGYWAPLQTSGNYEKFDIPSFNVTGWFDGQVQGTTKHYQGAVRTGTPSDHVLIIGPWLHGVNRPWSMGERDYGPQAIIPLDSIRDAWVDHRLLGEPRPELPNVAYFLPVRNEWRAADGWPIPGAEEARFYLDSEGGANTLLGDGRLGRSPGSGEPDEFTYDPADPVPTVSSRTAGARGGIAQGSVDNRAVETRRDVLVYTSQPLEEGMEVTGPVRARIFFSTDVPDTDITVKLLDVYPDGRALNLSHGIARARYRDSYERPTFLEPGQVNAVDVEMYPASNWFEPGHRIRIEVSSSNFPNLGRNLNTRESPEKGTEMRTATTRIHHSGEHASHIVLPVVPEGATRPWRDFR